MVVRDQYLDFGSMLGLSNEDATLCREQLRFRVPSESLLEKSKGFISGAVSRSGNHIICKLPRVELSAVRRTSKIFPGLCNHKHHIESLISSPLGPITLSLSCEMILPINSASDVLHVLRAQRGCANHLQRMHRVFAPA